MESNMKTRLILHDAPYGSERTYNGARMAGALAKKEGNEVKVFLRTLPRQRTTSRRCPAATPTLRSCWLPSPAMAAPLAFALAAWTPARFPPKTSSRLSIAAQWTT